MSLYKDAPKHLDKTCDILSLSKNFRQNSTVLRGIYQLIKFSNIFCIMKALKIRASIFVTPPWPDKGYGKGERGTDLSFSD